jgi:hypothetical protein
MTTTQSYYGPPLPTKEHVRILKLQPGSDDAPIRCQLLATTLASAPDYEAVSYTWGSSVDPQAVYIDVEGVGKPREHLVTSNCVSALRRFRYNNRPRLLWIDTLCIDQSNIPERNHQVTLMSTIYSQATQVLIYLGEASVDSDLALEFVEDIGRPAPRSFLLGTKPTRLIQALINLFRRPWFARVWVIQEAHLSRNATVHCGQTTLKWSSFQLFQRWNSCTGWLSNVPYVVYPYTPSVFTSIEVNHVTKEVYWNRVILREINNARHCRATDARDKIYALLPFLHLSEMSINITPDYNIPVTDLFTNFAAALVDRLGFGVLHACQGCSQIQGLPSWVPDWTIPTMRSSIMGDRPYFAPFHVSDHNGKHEDGLRIVRPTSGEPCVLRVSGVNYGRIQKVGPTYIAGHGPFPLEEWRALCADEDILIDPNLEPEDNEHNLDYLLGGVMSAGRTVLSAALMEEFVDKENELVESNCLEETWEYAVRKSAFITNDCEHNADYVVSFRDIPFLQAGKNVRASIRRHVENVLLSCHSRCVFLTDTGLLGLGSHGTRVGDGIYMCIGSPVPFVSRNVHATASEQDIKQVRLVGECYVSGMGWRELDHEFDEKEVLHVI